ncbi:MAG: monovalent cation/H(+) antiporter subunit G [Proteobacteria bacterium]|nr:monovalent cation/H(+) antiporter subunit G [Pseudomonadota bacterium]
MTELIGSLVILLGAIFLLLASIGVVRMPDSYNRIQTGTKATTLGLILVLTGIAIYHPGWTWKLVILIYFVLISNPASSHALARAAHRLGIFKTDTTVIDHLEEFETVAETEIDTDAGDSSGTEQEQS